MKKSICLLMAIVLLLSLCGCGETFEPNPTAKPQTTFSNELTIEEKAFVDALYIGTSDWANLESIKVLEIYFIERQYIHAATAKIQYVNEMGMQNSEVYYIALFRNEDYKKGDMSILKNYESNEPSELYNIEAINKKLQDKYMELSHEEQVVVYSIFQVTKHWDNKESIKVLQISDLIEFPTSVYAKIKHIDENGKEISSIYYIEDVYTEPKITIVEIEKGKWKPNTKYNIKAINYHLQNKYYENMIEQEGQEE